MGESRYQAVTLDATGSLIHCPRLGELYAEVLTRHGHTVDAAQARRLVDTVWKEFDCATSVHEDRFGSHPEGARGWWRRFLDRLCEHLGGRRPSRFAAAELYDRFGQAAAWEVYPEVPNVLSRLRGRRVRLAVVANWDERLPLLLARLGLAEYFESVITSQGTGVEKPHPLIFQTALRVLELEPAEVLHLGDRPFEDVEGSEAVGMAAGLIDRPHGADLESLTRRL